jgi:hypothetical protein
VFIVSGDSMGEGAEDDIELRFSPNEASALVRALLHYWFDNG